MPSALCHMQRYCKVIRTRWTRVCLVAGVKFSRRQAARRHEGCADLRHGLKYQVRPPRSLHGQPCLNSCVWASRKSVKKEFSDWIDLQSFPAGLRHQTHRRDSTRSERARGQSAGATFMSNRAFERVSDGRFSLTHKEQTERFKNAVSVIVALLVIMTNWCVCVCQTCTRSS